MNEENSDNKSKKINQMGVPVAIVIAGALVAVALFFGGDGGDNAGVGVNNKVAGQPQAAPVAPPEAAIGDMREVTDEDHIKGAANAKVTIVEYSDFECPFCKRFHPTVQKIVDEYPDDVRWVYRQFPLEALHSKAAKQAEATECAAEQGKFWEMTDKIFEVTPSNNGLDMDSLPTLAGQAGVANIAQFEACLESGKYAEKVAADVADAEAAGGRGTPYSVVIDSEGNKTPVNGAQPYEAVKQVVDAALN